MKTKLINKITGSVLIAFICSIGMLFGSSSAKAWDGQITPGWDCKPAGNEAQVAARYLKYRSNGSVYNNSTSSTIGVLCPILRKQNNRHINSVSVSYTDNHPDKSIRCTFRVMDTATGRNSFIKSAVTRSGVHSDYLSINNSSDNAGVNFVYCSLPPKVNGASSSINNVFVSQNEGPEPPWWCKIYIISCFDSGGISYNNLHGIVGKVSRPIHQGKAAYLTSTGSIANIDYDEALDVIFPLVRDDMGSTEAPYVYVGAEIYADNAGLAQCRLYQTNDGGQDSGIVLTWSDDDGDGKGGFWGSGDDNSMTSTSVYSVKCTLPPRVGSAISRIRYVSYYE